MKNKSSSQDATIHSSLKSGIKENDASIAKTLCSQWLGLSHNESDFLVNSSQFCALIKQSLEDISWVGFYWFRDNALVLGAFQGPVACSRISLDKGVCGVAFTHNQLQLVDDVDEFTGHIACDANSASELVIPLAIGGQVIGVLDLDSYSKGRFNQNLADSLQTLSLSFVETTRFPSFLLG